MEKEQKEEHRMPDKIHEEKALGPKKNEQKREHMQGVMPKAVTPQTAAPHKMHVEHKIDDSKIKLPKLSFNLIAAITIGLLIVFAGVQAYELVSLKNKLSGSGVSVSSAQPGTSASNTLQNNLKNLPTMVGGC